MIIESRYKVKGSRFITLNLSPTHKIDFVLAEEAQKRWGSYKSGELKTVSYETVMQKYK